MHGLELPPLDQAFDSVLRPQHWSEPCAQSRLAEVAPAALRPASILCLDDRVYANDSMGEGVRSPYEDDVVATAISRDGPCRAIRKGGMGNRHGETRRQTGVGRRHIVELDAVQPGRRPRVAVARDLDAAVEQGRREHEC